MWYPNQSQPLQSETSHMYTSQSLPTYSANQSVSSEQASTSNYPNYLQNPWPYPNPYASVDSSSYKNYPAHFNDLKETSQNVYISDDKVNLDSGKGDFNRVCENFIDQCRTIGNKKEARSKSRTYSGSRSNSYSGSLSVCSKKRSRSPSPKKHHRSYSKESSRERVSLTYSSSRHDKVKKSKKKHEKSEKRSLSPSKMREHHSFHFSWFNSDADTDNEKYLKFYKSIEKTTLKTVIKEISKIFDRTSGTEKEALQCLKDLHKREFTEYRKNPEFHPFYSLEKKKWDTHMKNKGFDLHHEAVEREWQKYFNIVLEKSCTDSWRKKEKKLMKKFLQNPNRNKSSVKTHSSDVRSGSKYSDSHLSRDKGNNKRLPETHSLGKQSSSSGLNEKKYCSSRNEKDKLLKNYSRSSKYCSEANVIKKYKEESRIKVNTSDQIKRRTSEVRERDSERSYSKHSTHQNRSSSSTRNSSYKDLSSRHNSSQKYENKNKVDKFVSNYIKKEPLEAYITKEDQFSKTVPKQSISVKDRLTFASPSKTPLKDRLYIPWETEKNFEGNSETNMETPIEIIPSISIQLQNKGSNYVSNERVIMLNNPERDSSISVKIGKNNNDDVSFSGQAHILHSEDLRHSLRKHSEDLRHSLRKGDIKKNGSMLDPSEKDKNCELKRELDNFSPHMNMFSVLNQMKEKFGSFADSIFQMYNTMSKFHKEGKILINYIDSDAETLLLLIKDKINDFISNSNTSFIQKAIYLETLTNLSSFLIEVQERKKALAEEPNRKESSLAKDVDIECLAKAVAGKDCTEMINFIKDYFQFRKLDFKKEDIVSVYMEVKKYQSLYVLKKNSEESDINKNSEESDINKNSEEQSSKKEFKKLAISSSKGNEGKHSMISRSTSSKCISKVGKKTVISKSGKKLSNINIKIGSNANSSPVKTSKHPPISLTNKDRNTSFKMQFKKAGSSAVSSLNILNDRNPPMSDNVKSNNSKSGDKKYRHSKTKTLLTPIYSVGQLVPLNLHEKIKIYENYLRYDRNMQDILDKYLKSIYITNLTMARVLGKCK